MYSMGYERPIASSLFRRAYYWERSCGDLFKVIPLRLDKFVELTPSLLRLLQTLL